VVIKTAGITLDEAKTFYEAAKDAYLHACSALNYKIGTRAKANQEIDKARNEMTYWDGIIKELEAKAAGRGRRLQGRYVPIDN
jgi:hypothetical protein